MTNRVSVTTQEGAEGAREAPCQLSTEGKSGVELKGIMGQYQLFSHLISKD